MRAPILFPLRLGATRYVDIVRGVPIILWLFLIAFTGDWERGCSLIRRAMELNPHHPGWYRLVLALNAYRTANYRDALNEATRANAPGVHLPGSSSTGGTS